MKEGVIIVALGHPNFAQLAGNLAMTIKRLNDVHISVVTQPQLISSLDARYKSKVDNFIFVEDSFFIHNDKKAWGRMKTRLWEVTPYHNTIYIDADSLWLSDKIQSWFEIIKSHNFCISYGSTFDPTAPDTHNRHWHWMTIEEVRKLFVLKNKRMPTHYQSSAMLFDDSAESIAMFQKATDAHDAIEASGVKFEKWFHVIPDELCFWIASGVLDYTPSYNLEPKMFFSSAAHRTPRTRIIADYDMVTFPSALHGLQEHERQLYNDVANHAAAKSGLHFPFQWKQKQNFQRLNQVHKGDRR